MHFDSERGESLGDTLRRSLFLECGLGVGMDVASPDGHFVM